MNKKRLKTVLHILICLTIVLTSMAVGALSYQAIVHPTDCRYNDAFVLGNTKENIIRAYGEFDVIDRDKCGYYVRSAPEYPEYIEICYTIKFNTKDVATDVYLAYDYGELSSRVLDTIAIMKWRMQQIEYDLKH